MKYIGKVLLVEDSEIDVFIHKKVITASGLSSELEHCPTGKQALDYLSRITEVSEIPRYLFLDIRMPDMDGFEFLEAFGNLPERIRKDISIIMLSSTVDEKELNEARSNKFVHAFIPKPLTLDKMKELFD
jgi:CheY-like chemotaxis protein